MERTTGAPGPDEAQMVRLCVWVKRFDLSFANTGPSHKPDQIRYDTHAIHTNDLFIHWQPEPSGHITVNRYSYEN